jgi:hypothetical protein
VASAHLPSSTAGKGPSTRPAAVGHRKNAGVITVDDEVAGHATDMADLTGPIGAHIVSIHHDTGGPLPREHDRGGREGR